MICFLCFYSNQNSEILYVRVLNSLCQITLSYAASGYTILRGEIADGWSTTFTHKATIWIINTCKTNVMVIDRKDGFHL